ncbi:MAG: hypothetical protein V3V71_06365 [Roseateles sp.]|nr:hypothetical protein [Burkholderiaceae bacterium]
MDNDFTHREHRQVFRIAGDEATRNVVRQHLEGLRHQLSVRYRADSDLIKESLSRV